MTDYRALIAPFLGSISASKRTINRYTKCIKAFIDFLEAGHYVPDEAYYKALEAHLSGQDLGERTKKARVSLARRFFTWKLKQQGDRQIPMTEINETILNSDEEAAKTTFDEADKATIPEQVQATNDEEPVAFPNVDATPQQTSNETNDNPDNVMQPQTQKMQDTSQATSKNTVGRPKKSDEGRTVKISVYLTPTLDADLKDLARIQRLSTADYIFRLIEKARDRRTEALATFRALEEDD